jgi:phage shock protein PspC (stress-responsive transcriptional regulator)
LQAKDKILFKASKGQIGLASYWSMTMRIFRWLVVVSVVVGAIVGAVELYIALFVNPWSFAVSAGTNDRIPASQLPGQTPFPMIFLAVEVIGLLVALLSGVMYGVSGRLGWQITLWVAAIILLFPSALAAFFSFSFFVPTFHPAGILMFLAAMFSLSAHIASGNADVERQPLIQPSPKAASQQRMRIILGIVVALLGGAAIIFLFQVSWVAILITLSVSSIGATLLIRSPLSALVVPAAIWLGAMLALICNGIARGGFADSTFWWGALEFAGILIVIAVIPALVGVGIGALLTRWLPGVSA